MTSRTRSHPFAPAAAGAAAALLGLLTVGRGVAAAGETGGAPGGADTGRPADAVLLTASTGPDGPTVRVRARCAGGTRNAAVFSPAFARPAPLRAAPDGVSVAEAAVRPGLAPGRPYVVTANCNAAESLTTTFVAPGEAASARATPAPPAHTASSSTGDRVALVFGGALAAGGIAAYRVTARRAPGPHPSRRSTRSAGDER
ncbi:hypothetical protein [Streptomyces sp. TR06-5]|uniref:hypothetical protein n=1 Tax=Streptomyces sp. TR06-5 TaxID=3385976 RepID=UPI0039A1148D